MLTLSSHMWVIFMWIWRCVSGRCYVTWPSSHQALAFGKLDWHLYSVTETFPGPAVTKKPQIITLPSPCLTGGCAYTIYTVFWFFRQTCRQAMRPNIQQRTLFQKSFGFKYSLRAPSSSLGPRPESEGSAQDLSCSQYCTLLDGS